MDKVNTYKFWLMDLAMNDIEKYLQDIVPTEKQIARLKMITNIADKKALEKKKTTP